MKSVLREEKNIRRKGFVKRVSFKPGMKHEGVRGVDDDELIENDDLIAV